jgi:hypothetical protein
MGQFSAFSVDNIEHACARLESNGVSFQKKLADGRQKNIAFALDPDGYWVSFFSSETEFEPDRRRDMHHLRQPELTAKPKGRIDRSGRKQRRSNNDRPPIVPLQPHHDPREGPREVAAVLPLRAGDESPPYHGKAGGQVQPLLPWVPPTRVPGGPPHR